MALVLLADIGGTHSRFALTETHRAADSASPFGDGVENATSVANDGFASAGEAIERYLAGVGVRPVEAVLAVAAPVKGPEIALTNRGWQFRLDDIKARFGLGRVRAINDFEAQAWALSLLRPADLQPIGHVAEARGPKVVLGPGTGLGVAALLPDGGGQKVVATEAGHISFGASVDDEETLFARLRRDRRVTAETILSGPGMAHLHAALHPGAPRLTAESIVASARAGEAPALATTRMFVRLLGRFAGDMMLVFTASGGVYISGGVAQALGDHFDAGIFRAAFDEHPPYAAMLAKTPTYLITHPQPGLLGCAAVAATP